MYKTENTAWTFVLLSEKDRSYRFYVMDSKTVDDSTCGQKLDYDEIDSFTADRELFSLLIHQLSAIN